MYTHDLRTTACYARRLVRAKPKAKRHDKWSVIIFQNEHYHAHERNYYWYRLQHFLEFALHPSNFVFQLCLLRFTPPGPGNYRHTIECALNNDPGGTQTVELFGQGAVPTVRAICVGSEGSDGGAMIEMGESSNWGSEIGADWDGRPTMYMRPTCVGLVSSGNVKARMRCRVA